MFIANNMVEAIRKAAATIHEDVTENNPTRDRTIDELIAFRQAEIPRIVAAKQMEGSNHAEVHSLVRDRDFVFPNWASRFYRRPQIDWLDRMSADIFAYCVQMGFKTHLVKFSGIGKSHSAIVIEWELPEALCRELSGHDKRDGFVTALRDQSAAARAKEALKVRAEREKKAKAGIEAARKALKTAAAGGGQKTSILSLQNSFKSIDPENYDTWEGDVMKWCKGVGLTVTVTSTSGWKGTHYHYVYASWDQPPTF